MFHRMRSRLEGSSPRQVLFSKLARAAATARSTSPASASGTVVISSPVAGLTTSMLLQVGVDALSQCSAASRDGTYVRAAHGDAHVGQRQPDHHHHRGPGDQR